MIIKPIFKATLAAIDFADIGRHRIEFVWAKFAIQGVCAISVRRQPADWLIEPRDGYGLGKMNIGDHLIVG